MIQDNIEAVPDFFLSVWFSSLASAMSSNSWTAAALVALALCIPVVWEKYQLRRSYARASRLEGGAE